MLKMYGIPNCDTIKKARVWLEKNKIKYEFHNFKTEGIDREKLKEWAAKYEWQLLLNKKGTTWRKLAPSLPSTELTRAGTLKLLSQHPSMIKRPVIEYGDKLLVGFDELVYKEQFLRKK